MSLLHSSTCHLHSETSSLLSPGMQVQDLCVFMCMCRNDDEMDVPFGDEPEDKQNDLEDLG